MNEGEAAEQVFSRAVSANSGIHLHHEKLKQMLKAQEKVRSINNAQQEEEKGTTDNDKYSDLGPRIVSEAKSAVNDLQDLQQKPDDKISVTDRTAVLNADQSHVFQCVSGHLNHQHRHEMGACNCKDIHPLHMFVSGVGGMDKSFPQ